LPWFILIAGPNGAGKTTLTATADFQNSLSLFPGGPVRLLNPDDAARAYYAANPGITRASADGWAANAIPAQLVQCIDAGENVAVDLKARLAAQEPPQSGPKTGGMPFPSRS